MSVDDYIRPRRRLMLVLDVLVWLFFCSFVCFQVLCAALRINTGRGFIFVLFLIGSFLLVFSIIWIIARTTAGYLAQVQRLDALDPPRQVNRWVAMTPLFAMVGVLFAGYFATLLVTAFLSQRR
jgi:hypothetical protein